MYVEISTAGEATVKVGQGSDTFQTLTDELWRYLNQTSSPEYRETVMEMWHRENGRSFTIEMGGETDSFSLKHEATPDYVTHAIADALAASPAFSSVDVNDPHCEMLVTTKEGPARFRVMVVSIVDGLDN